MKRKTSTAPTRIYTYGCRLPILGSNLVEEQLRLARAYHNKLIEIELARKVKVREAMTSVSSVSVALDVLNELNKQIETERTIINATKAAARSSAVDVGVQRARIRDLQGQRKEAFTVLKAAKMASKTPEMVAKFEEIGNEANEAIRAARATCNVYWGTYLLVEKAIEEAKAPPKKGQRKGELRFRHWDGCGRVGVQLQGGLPVAAAFGSDTRLRIAPLPTTGSKRGMTMTTVHIRVGSDEKGGPIWAAFPFRLHRPLPTDGTIKWTWIHRTFKGRWTNYDLQIVVEAPSFARPERPPHDGGVVALDLGWRKRIRETTPDKSDLRVAYYHDDQGRHGEILLDAEIRQKLDHANSLRSIEDRNFDEIKTVLLAWMEGHPLPDGLKETFEHFAKWRSAKRMGAAIDQWKISRTNGDDEIFERLAAWWKQHRHLYDWESCERDRTLNRRLDFYRNVAADLTRRYAVVVIEDFDLRRVTEHELPESERKEAPAPARYNRVISSPSEFRGTIKSAAPGNGCRVVEVDCSYTTVQCHRCCRIEKWDAAANLVHTCACGHTWDQDYNAAINLLARFASGEMPPKLPPSLSEATSIANKEVLESESATR